jgi:hypothetical protein
VLLTRTLPSRPRTDISRTRKQLSRTKIRH